MAWRADVTALLVLALLFTTMLPFATRQTLSPRTGDASNVLQGVNLNTAPWYELDQLPGVGERLAHRIVEYREGRAASAKGTPAFSTVADLAQVKGIGRKTVQRVSPFVAFGDR